MFLLIGVLLSSSCATYWQAKDLEVKVDRLLKNTNRETMRQIFGEQSSEITRKMEELNEGERDQLDEIVEAYQKGSSSIEEVRASVLTTLGGTERVVSSGRGIWVRDENGAKLRTVGRNKKIKNCRRVKVDELPESISKSRALKRFAWGAGEVNGKKVLFPWELTMSSFAREIVENTAKRTAQEFLRMSGEKGWRRPVYIQVTTEQPGKLTVSSENSEDIFVTPGNEVPAQKSEEKPKE